MYSEFNKGYVLYRRRNGTNNRYFKNIEDDIIYEVFESEHQLVLPGNSLFSLLNKNGVGWCVYSNFITENTFELIRSTINSILKEDYLVEPDIENLKLINAEYSLKGLNITVEERVYNLSFHLSNKQEMTLNIVAKPNSIPISIPLNKHNLNLSKYIETIEVANRFIRLFDD